MKNIVVIVQARMTSTRLPGKVLMPLGDKSVLGQVLTRCQQIEKISEVCCAIPDDSCHDNIAAEAKKYHATIFRGSEHNVLERYYQAAIHTKADIIMRVTSDCPLINPAVCSTVLNMHLHSDADYTCNNMPPSWPHGYDCEVFNFDAIKRAYHQALLDEEKEHVTPWIRKNLKTQNYLNPQGNHYSLRITLDTPEDYINIKKVFDGEEHAHLL